MHRCALETRPPQQPFRVREFRVELKISSPTAVRESTTHGLPQGGAARCLLYFECIWKPSWRKRNAWMGISSCDGILWHPRDSFSDIISCSPQDRRLRSALSPAQRTLATELVTAFREGDNVPPLYFRLYRHEPTCCMRLHSSATGIFINFLTAVAGIDGKQYAMSCHARGQLFSRVYDGTREVNDHKAGRGGRLL